jgi:hypothetical protein
MRNHIPYKKGNHPGSQSGILGTSFYPPKGLNPILKEITQAISFDRSLSL